MAEKGKVNQERAKEYSCENSAQKISEIYNRLKLK